VNPKAKKKVAITRKKSSSSGDGWGSGLTLSPKGKKAAVAKPTSARKVGGPAKKKSSEDYQGKYKETATKPSSDDGWGKISAHNKKSAK
jgi:hypothetical protein